MFKWLTLPATVAIAATALFPKRNASNDSDDGKDKLLLVHVFHRHGDRTPWFAMEGKEKSEKLWIPLIAKQYTLFDPQSLQPLPSVDTSNIHSWRHIADRLKGISLTYKHDNWNRLSPTVFHADEDEEQLAALRTVDQTEYPHLGQLTDKGCEQLENVGKLLRKRYVDDLKYLPSEYDASSTNLHYHSTNTARTIQSADCLLQELYPPDRRKNNAFVPVHVDVNLTYLSPTRMKTRFCEKLKQKAEQNEEVTVQRMGQRFHELVDNVIRHYRIDANVWHIPKHAILFDGMTCRMSHDMDGIPEWFGSSDMEQFGKYLTKIMNAVIGLDEESLRLTWGNVMHKMMVSMKAVEYDKNNENNGQMIISSCHDDSLLAVLGSLYGKDIHDADLSWPPYASYIIFELWKAAKSEKKYVKVIYNGEPLKIFNGSHCIDLDELERKWKGVMIHESAYWTGACAC